MSTVGQIEKKSQQRVVKLFREQLGYDYLGDWTEREGNRNIEDGLLRTFLRHKQGYDEAVITRALHLLDKAAGDTSKSLYDRNHAVYDLLRYGVKVRAEVGENTQTVWLIDWKHPERNHFAIAEEVTVPGADAKAHTKRPDVVLYVNGIALGVLELKRSTVSVAQGIRQNLDNQKKVFVEHFFSTVQWLMAGNDTEGLRYGAIQTPEKYYLAWKEASPIDNPLDRALVQLIVERGAAAVDALPDRIKKNKEAVAEAIENNVRKLIIDEQPINPKYYEKMPELLDALIDQRRKEAMDYQEYLRRIVELTKKVTSPETSGEYPARMNTPGKRALYDNLDKDEGLALAVDTAVRASRQDDWRSNPFKIRRVRNAIRSALEGLGAQAGVVLEAPAAYPLRLRNASFLKFLTGATDMIGVRH